MKNLVFVVALMVSFNLLAVDKGYLCLVEESDFETVEKLQLPGYVTEIGMIEVELKNCNIPHVAIYTDVCTINENTITVGLDLTKSTLKTKEGLVLPLFCEKNGDVVTAQ